MCIRDRDNADKRLTDKGIKIGLISDERKSFYQDKSAKINIILVKMLKLNISPSKVDKFHIKIAKDGVKRSALDILSRKEVNFKKLRSIWRKIPRRYKGLFYR